MIVGSVYVYGKWGNVTWEQTTVSGDKDEDALNGITMDANYCDYTTYIFAFVVITIGFVSLFFSVLGAICTCFCKGSDSEE